jgi:hypothetical protein
MNIFAPLIAKQAPNYSKPNFLLLAMLPRQPVLSGANNTLLLLVVVESWVLKAGTPTRRFLCNDLSRFLSF